MSTTENSRSEAAEEYLGPFLNKTLHVHTIDGRMFVGQMKCTDSARNIILAMTQEYRHPTQSDIRLAAMKHEQAKKTGKFKVDMKKRFVGLVVIPGQYITKIEAED